jgi:hypothetical protein
MRCQRFFDATLMLFRQAMMPRRHYYAERAFHAELFSPALMLASLSRHAIIDYCHFRFDASAAIIFRMPFH